MISIEYNNIADFHSQNNLPAPENPLFSVVHHKLKEDEELNCNSNEFNEPVSLSCQFYSISLKKIISGEFIYGRTKYDSTNGTMLFTAPNQKMIYKNMVYSSESYHILFHKDYIRNTDIYKKIKKYSFFNYNVNEALHLSPKEEQLIKDIFRNIDVEYQNNQDEFSKEIIIALIEALLKYADRFYKRQFLNRKDINKNLISRFKNILNLYFEESLFEKKGIPSVNWMAEQLKVSYRYMNDTIKAETGKNAKEHIILFLVEEAKNMLLNPELSIAQTSHKLGFEYPAYFARIFKKKVGMSPKDFINMYSLN